MNIRYRCHSLGSGLIGYSEKMAVAARAMAEKRAWASGLASGDATPVLQAAEHDLDAAAPPVTALVVSDWLVA